MRRNVFWALFFSTILAIGLYTLFLTSANAEVSELKTASAVELKRYTGTWYEIARYPNESQKDCVGNVTATYFQQIDGDITVINKCLKKDGKFKTERGEAQANDESNEAKLAVSFAPKLVSFLPYVWSEYWIIDVGENYKYSVVSDSNRENLQILSRTPEIDDAVYQNILQAIEEKGFNANKLVKTPQNFGKNLN